ncbi:MaoC/PaaZ C-terminal domain-containing protein [Pseudonocardia sp. CA-107938]|uniref:MaoC/PaaZ C-terminal domain-containing protein n=1 Tax=Pseudonocardia sp. CA-107938 TaxID=3240021 RepID=UPI003D92599D
MSRAVLRGEFRESEFVLGAACGRAQRRPHDQWSAPLDDRGRRARAPPGRSWLVQHAGATGDVDPVHTDERHARDAVGLSGVVAHGMLTMAVTGTLLGDVVGIENVTRFGGRFTARSSQGTACPVFHRRPLVDRPGRGRSPRPRSTDGQPSRCRGLRGHGALVHDGPR